MERAEEVHDVMHPLDEIGPVPDAAVVRGGRNGLEATQKLPELDVTELAENLGIRIGQMGPERKHAAGQRQHHQRLRDHLTCEPARTALRALREEACDRARGAARQGWPACCRGQERLERAPPEILLRDVRSIERLANLRLESYLLVEADFEVRQYRKLSSHLGVMLDSYPLVAAEGLAQVALSSRRIAGPQFVEEPLERSGLDWRIRRALAQEARELRADLLEHLQVAACDGVACALERVERGVQLGRQAAEPCPGLKQSTAQQAPP